MLIYKVFDRWATSTSGTPVFPMHGIQNPDVGDMPVPRPEPQMPDPPAPAAAPAAQEQEDAAMAPAPAPAAPAGTDASSSVGVRRGPELFNIADDVEEPASSRRRLTGRVHGLARRVRGRSQDEEAREGSRDQPEPASAWHRGRLPGGHEERVDQALSRSAATSPPRARRRRARTCSTRGTS